MLDRNPLGCARMQTRKLMHVRETYRDDEYSRLVRVEAYYRNDAPNGVGVIVEGGDLAWFDEGMRDYEEAWEEADAAGREHIVRTYFGQLAGVGNGTGRGPVGQRQPLQCVEHRVPRAPRLHRGRSAQRLPVRLRCRSRPPRRPSVRGGWRLPASGAACSASRRCGTRPRITRRCDRCWNCCETDT